MAAGRRADTIARERASVLKALDDLSGIRDDLPAERRQALRRIEERFRTALDGYNAQLGAPPVLRLMSF